MPSAGDILVVDDDLPTIEFIAEALAEEGYSVRTAVDEASARAAVAQRRPDLLLLDLHLPDKVGDVLTHDLKYDGLANVPVVIMTTDAKAASGLSADGIVFCLIKPFELDDLFDCVAKYIR